MAETPETRDALPPQLRAISDALDEWLARKHGIISSWQSPQWFLKWLEEKGWTVVDCKRLEAAEKWLKEKARHTMHCGWKDGMYDAKRGCTCGLATLVGEETRAPNDSRAADQTSKSPEAQG